MHLSVVIPTYKEKENLAELLPAIHSTLSSLKISYNVIVVDDDSADGTIDLIHSMKHLPIELVLRRGKRGLSSAVHDGVARAKGEIIAFMDADLSHPPTALAGMFDWIHSGKADLVIGSRLVSGGGMADWPWTRRLTSWVARMMIRPLTPVRDITSGFFMFRREVYPTKQLNLKGFKIGLEVVIKGKYSQVKEFPIVFQDRKHGESKLTGKIMREYLRQLRQLYLYTFLKKASGSSTHRNSIER
ncbi:MAG: polyprenol monophosphomannose synthase [Candidatus Margulisiibacteriota bacterium]